MHDCLSQHTALPSLITSLYTREAATLVTSLYPESTGLKDSLVSVATCWSGLRRSRLGPRKSYDRLCEASSRIAASTAAIMEVWYLRKKRHWQSASFGNQHVLACFLAHVASSKMAVHTAARTEVSYFSTPQKRFRMGFCLDNIKGLNVHTYIHIYIRCVHAYIHTYRHACMHYIHTCTHYMHAYRNTYIQEYMHTSMHK